MNHCYTMRATDQQIIDGLLSKDEKLTHDFFHVWCRPLISSLIHKVFDYPVDYDEIVDDYHCFEALNIPKHHPARDISLPLRFTHLRILIDRTPPGQGGLRISGAQNVQQKNSGHKAG